jgi:hypothetical protein
MKTNLFLTAALSLSLCAASTAQTLPSYLPTDGLVGWWPFNGNANDESGNGNDGIVNSATLTIDRNGIENSAYSFDGISSVIEVPFSSTLNSIQTGLTMTGWIYMDGGPSAATPPRVLELRGAYGNGGDAGFVMLAQGNSNESRSFEVRWYNEFGDNNISIAQTQNIDALSWHHIAFSCNGLTGVGNFYIDGLFAGSNSGQALQGFINNCNYNNNPLLIGSEISGLGHWGGYLDDIAIYNRALSQEEITALYTGETINPPTTCNPLPANLQNGLVGYWPFCGNANDESGNGNDGTVNGATLTEDRFGVANNAYSFDGVDDGVSVNPSPQLVFNNSQAISYWLKMSEFPVDGNEHHVISKCGPIGTGWEMVVSNYQNNNWLEYRFWGNPNPLDNGTEVHIPFELIQPNEYNHFLVNQNADSIYFYMNGDLITHKPKPGSFDANNNVDLTFGTRDTIADFAYPYYGILDDIGIWNRALTPDEVQQLYTLNACTFTIYDTVTVTQTVYDTVSVSVSTTDTLIINTLITSVEPAQENTFLVYPNPAGSQITINNGNVGILGGYTMRITNSSGQEVYNQNITQTEVTLDLGNWGGSGLYVLYITDPQGEIIAVKQIVLQ